MRQSIAYWLCIGLTFYMGIAGHKQMAASFFAAALVLYAMPKTEDKL